MTIKTFVYEAGVALVILLLVYSGTIKFLHYASFTHDMQNQVFPGWLKTLLITSLPAVELIIAALMIFTRSRFIGLLGSFALIGSFTIYTAGALLNWYSRTPCACGGIINVFTWPQHLLFNSFFLVVVITSILLHRNQGSFTSNQPGHHHHAPTQ